MKTIKNANANYTGGGFYEFTGEFTDGTYFLTTMEEDCVNIISVPWEYDENGYADIGDGEWLDYLEGAEGISMIIDILEWIIANKSEGNYLMEDIKKTLSAYQAKQNPFKTKINTVKKILDTMSMDLEKLMQGESDDMSMLTISYNGLSADIPVDYPETYESVECSLKDIQATLEGIIEDYFD